MRWEIAEVRNPKMRVENVIMKAPIQGPWPRPHAVTASRLLLTGVSSGPEHMGSESWPFLTLIVWAENCTHHADLFLFLPAFQKKSVLRAFAKVRDRGKEAGAKVFDGTGT